MQVTIVYKFRYMAAIGIACLLFQATTYLSLAQTVVPDPPTPQHTFTDPHQELNNGIPTVLATAPNGQLLAVGATNGLHFFDANTLSPLAKWPLGQHIEDLVYSADGQYLRINQRVYFADLSKPYYALDVEAQTIAWRDADCSPNGKTCIDFDPSRHAFDVIDTDTAIVTHQVKEWYVADVAWSADGTQLFTISGRALSRPNQIEAWDTTTWHVNQSVDNYFNVYGYDPSPKRVKDNLLITFVKWAADSQHITNGHEVWNIQTGNQIGHINCKDEAFVSSFGNEICKIGPMVQMPFTAVRRLNPETRRSYGGFEPHYIWLNAADIDSSNTFLATSGSDHGGCRHDVDSVGRRVCDDKAYSTVVWWWDTFEEHSRLPTGLDELHFVPNHTNLLLGINLWADQIELWDWHTHEQIVNIPWRDPYGLPFSNYRSVAPDPTNTYILERVERKPDSPQQYHLNLWRITDGALVARYVAPIPIMQARISPDGTKIAALLEDDRIWVWSTP